MIHIIYKSYTALTLLQCAAVAKLWPDDDPHRYMYGVDVKTGAIADKFPARVRA
jgi:hypothetical protein